jgi:topoisomerase-4 subunit A
MIAEWCRFRLATVERRTRHRLTAAEKRIHILEGRQAILLDIDRVIKVIRESDDPKADLMAHFKLSAIQAEDILEIRLRQLARLEGIKIGEELAKLREEAAGLNHLLSSESAARLRRRRNRGRCEEIRRRPPDLIEASERSRCPMPRRFRSSTSRPR